MRFEQFASGDAGPTASSPKHAQKFPLCGQYLRIWMNPKKLNDAVPKRWKTFVKWCGSEDRAVEACAWDKGPLVQINSVKVGHANGRYLGGDTVFIHGKVADKYESGDGWVIWEAITLHELVHWARFQNKLKDPPDDDIGDVGKHFVLEAYGEAIDLSSPWRRGP
jgi:Metallopeptidase toxin 3